MKASSQMFIQRLWEIFRRKVDFFSPKGLFLGISCAVSLLQNQYHYFKFLFCLSFFDWFSFDDLFLQQYLTKSSHVNDEQKDALLSLHAQQLLVSAVST